jgi:hypothetical protein
MLMMKGLDLERRDHSVLGGDGPNGRGDSERKHQS